jgi:hypothetical protein
LHNFTYVYESLTLNVVYKPNIILYLRMKTLKAAILYLLPVLLTQISSLNLKKTPVGSNILHQSQSIVTGDTIVSPSGAIKLKLLANGNIVLIGCDNTIYWTISPPNSSPPQQRTLLLKSSGDLILYEKATKNIVWSTNSGKLGKPVYYLAVQDDGNLVIYDKTTTPIWDSNTDGAGQC